MRLTTISILRKFILFGFTFIHNNNLEKNKLLKFRLMGNVNG